uniref:ABM domain-containing protein n=1 Tax=Noctiluca scintillans TaxID=2966 RepID=A0A7S0ZVF3_NOCSC
MAQVSWLKVPTELKITKNNMASTANFESKFFTIEPTFDVKDWAAAQPVLEEFFEKSSSEEGCFFYGFTKVGDKLFCREGYVNGEAVLAHLQNVAAPFAKILAGPASLDKLEFHAPASELDKVKEATAALNPVFFEVDSGFTKVTKEAGGTQTPQSMVSLHPRFTVKDWAAAQPIMAEFVEKTATEGSCLYYGWTKNENTLLCRESYTDACGVLAHLENVGPLLDKMLAGPAALDSISIHGPAAELEKLKEATAALGTVYFEVVDGSFSRYEV